MKIAETKDNFVSENLPSTEDYKHVDYFGSFKPLRS